MVNRMQVKDVISVMGVQNASHRTTWTAHSSDYVDCKISGVLQEHIHIFVSPVFSIVLKCL